MSKYFNLLLLHLPTDIHPRTWISLKGVEIKKIFRELEKDVLKNHGWCREELSRKVGNCLNCSHSTIKQILIGKSEFYPIPIILELSKLSKNKEKFLKEFKKNIEYLKVNSASAKPVKAVHKLNKNLAKILGAFMADGSLSVQIVIASPQSKDLNKVKSNLKKLGINYSFGKAPSRKQYYISTHINKDNLSSLNRVIRSLRFRIQTHYNTDLNEEYKDSVEAFIRWIKKGFGINPTNFRMRRNSWRVIFSNKILARYLMCFFEVKPGPKAYSTFEPKIIKTSNLIIRKAFAKGVLMFDGCVTKQKKITFGVVSQKLYDSIKQIWEKDKIKFGKSINYEGSNYNFRKKRNSFILFTTAKNKKGKLLQYFEPDTQKWKLLNWLSGDLNYSPIVKDGHHISLEKLMKVLQKIKLCDASFLKTYFKSTHTTIRVYLKILKDQKKIRLSDHPRYINSYINKNTTILLKNRFHNLIFKKIRDGFEKDQNCAKFLEVHKSTFSAWKVKKNRIPLHVLKRLCKILNLDLNKVFINIEKTDREIAEII